MAHPKTGAMDDIEYSVSSDVLDENGEVVRLFYMPPIWIGAEQRMDPDYVVTYGVDVQNDGVHIQPVIWVDS
jgi:hypothetical protein